LEISASGGLKPCCNYDPIAHLDSSGAAVARRSDAFRRLREQLLSGELSSTCARCHIRRTVPVSALKAEVVSARAGGEGLEALLEPWPLTEVRVDINEKCNLRCTYCAVSGPDYLGVEMTDAIFDQAEQIIQDSETNLVVHVNGHGETTFHPKWVEYCGRLIARGAPLTIITNLAKVYSADEVALLSRFHRIQISLDSADPELMRKIRKAVKIDTIIANIDRIRASATERSAKAPEFSFSVGVYDPAVWTLLGLVEFIIARRATSVTFWNLVEYKHQSEVRGLSRLETPVQDRARALVATARATLEWAGIRCYLEGDMLGDSERLTRNLQM
jgi:sulfatase maturation enzyme AslB (radical SAM superfamily)